MRIVILSVGRSSKGPERDLIDRYAKRIVPLAKQLGFGTLERREIGESRLSSVEGRQQDEATRLLKLCEASLIVALDERGQTMTSLDFAKDMQKLRTSNKDITFIIGGPDGLAEDLRKKAQNVLSFGAMTWPHQLTCAMLTEQIYRSMTLLAGHPYHRQ